MYISHLLTDLDSYKKWSKTKQLSFFFWLKCALNTVQVQESLLKMDDMSLIVLHILSEKNTDFSFSEKEKKRKKDLGMDVQRDTRFVTLKSTCFVYCVCFMFRCSIHIYIVYLSRQGKEGWGTVDFGRNC